MPCLCEVLRGDGLSPNPPPAPGETHPKTPAGQRAVPDGCWGPAEEPGARGCQGGFGAAVPQRWSPARVVITMIS